MTGLGIIAVLLVLLSIGVAVSLLQGRRRQERLRSLLASLDASLPIPNDHASIVRFLEIARSLDALDRRWERRWLESLGPRRTDISARLWSTLDALLDRADHERPAAEELRRGAVAWFEDARAVAERWIALVEAPETAASLVLGQLVRPSAQASRLVWQTLEELQLSTVAELGTEYVSRVRQAVERLDDERLDLACGAIAGVVTSLATVVEGLDAKTHQLVLRALLKRMEAAAARPGLDESLAADLESAGDDVRASLDENE